MSAGAINTNCPWSGNDVAANSLTQYRGSTVGFCNPGCRDKFERATHHFDQHLPGHQEESRALAGCILASDYNQTFNAQLLGCLGDLSEERYFEDLGAFFGSIHVTLNHILVWDIVWMKRILESGREFSALSPLNDWPMPTANDEIVADGLMQLRDVRAEMDAYICGFARELETSDLSLRIRYKRQNGDQYEHEMRSLVQHVFNHQTHHRGQITTLMSQSGVDVGVTDMLALLPNFAAA